MADGIALIPSKNEIVFTYSVYKHNILSILICLFTGLRGPYNNNLIILYTICTKHSNLINKNNFFQLIILSR